MKKFILIFITALSAYSANSQCLMANVSGGGTSCTGQSFEIILMSGIGHLDTEAIYKLYRGSTLISSIRGFDDNDQPRTSIIWNQSIAGTYTVRANGNGCSNTLMDGSAEIKVSSSSTIIISANSNPSQVCNPASFVMTASGGSGYRWYRQGAPLDSNPTGPTFSPDDPGTYYATGVNNCGVTLESERISVSFLSVTTPPISGVSSRCQGSGSDAYSASAQNVNSYSWSIAAGSSTISPSGVVSWDSGFFGTAVITVTAYGCAGSVKSNQYNVSVTPRVSTPTLSGPLSRCIGAGTTSYTASASNAHGYSWSVSGGGNTVSPSGVVTWDSSFTGTAQVMVIALGCNGSTSSQTVNVDVFTIPMANVSGTGAACAGTIFPISLNPISGTTLDPSSVYTLYKDGISTNISVPGYNSNDQPRSGGTLWSVTASGTYTVVASRSGCSDVLMNGSVVISNTVSTTIIISANSNPSQVCNPASFVMTASGGSGYRWYRQGAPLDSNPTGPTFSPDDPGTYYATGVNNCGVTLESERISVSFLSVTTPPISGVSSRCQGSGSDAYSASAQNVNSYSWSIAAGSSTISPSGVVSWDSGFFGTAVITVTAYGCAGSVKSNQYNVSVTPRVSTPTLSGPLSRCIGAGTTSYTASASNAHGYSWSVSGGGNTVSPSGVVTWDSSFTGTAQVMVIALGCNGSTSSQTVNVDVFTIPMANVSGTGAACAGTIFPISLNPISGTTLDPSSVYTLYKDGISTNISVPGYNSNDQPRSGGTLWSVTASGTYTVVASRSGCSDVLMNGSVVISNTVSTTIIISANSNPSQVCNPASFVMTASGGSGYRWYRQGAPLDSNPTGPTFSPDDPGTYYATGVNNCGVTLESERISVSFLSVTTPPISGVSSRCQGSGSDAYSASAQNVNSYSWSIAAGSSTISPSGVVSWDSGFFGTAVITVTAYGCAGSVKSNQYNVSVNPKPAIPNSLNSSSICSGSTFSYTPTSSAPGATFNWSRATVSGISEVSNSGTGTISEVLTNTTTSPINVSYIYDVTANGCGGLPTTITVTINPKPTLSSSLSQPYITSGRTFNYAPTSATSGAIFSWSRAFIAGVSEPANTGVGNVNEILTNTTTNPINVTYFYIVEANGCTGFPTAVVVAINAIPNNYNYIISRDIQSDKKADGSAITEADIASLPVHLKAESTTYFDGLGRPMQSVSTQASPNKKDIVNPISYDDFGRENIKYLPYISVDTDGFYKRLGIAEQASFYTSPPTNIINDNRPFSETIFEPSPLNRPSKQYSPGQEWKDANNNKPVSHEYLINEENEIHLFVYDPSTGLVTKGLYYGANQLYANKTTDEQGHEVIEYTDKEGRTVCKKVEAGSNGGVKQYASTYYIYDDLGNLTVVLPPEGLRKLTE